MKKLLLILGMIVFTFSMNAQKVNKTDLFDTNMSVDLQKKKFKSKVEAKSIKLRDGSIVKLGDTLTIGSSTNKISNTYSTLTVGRYSKAAIAMGGVPVYYGLTIKNTKTVLDRIRIFRSMGRVTVVGDLKQLEVSSKAMYSYIGAINMDVGFSEGELINPNAPMTRDQAIDKLKEFKVLFDLGLMNEEGYNLIKKELTPIIMGN
jgi:hypothetical protein